jgi:integrase
MKTGYWLTVEELQKFREALDKYKDQSAANALRLLLLTGSRASEVLKATWEEFDLQRGVWTKPSHHTKQKKQEHMPLSAPARKLLESIAPRDLTGPLFPGRDGKGQRVSLKRPWVQSCKAAGLAEKYTVQGKRGPLTRYRPTLRVHDLRHNFASHLASNGVSLQVVGKLLGHTQASTTMRYAHLQDAPLRNAANQFGRIFLEVPHRMTKPRRAYLNRAH